MWELIRFNFNRLGGKLRAPTRRTSPQHCIKGRNVLFNDTLNTFYLWLCGVRRMVKDHLHSQRGNPLPFHGLLFPISSKGSFICISSQTG